MEVQHVNVKVFAQEPAPTDLSGAIAVFQRWIREGKTGELLIDVVDYRHVPGGPGVVLVGDEVQYAIETTHGSLGLLYNRRRKAEGSTREKIASAFDTAMAACKRLEQEPEFRGRLKFHTGDVELRFNDRALTPNNAETYARLKPEIEEFFTSRWGAGSFAVSKTGEPRDLLRVRVTVEAGRPQPV